MSKPSILVLGKRGGILQWYENILDAASELPQHQLNGFALNHGNGWQRSIKHVNRLLLGDKGSERYISSLLDQKLLQLTPDIILIVDLFYLNPLMVQTLKNYKDAHPASRIYQWIGDFFDERLCHNNAVVDHYFFTDSTFIQDAKALGICQSSYLPLATSPRIFNCQTCFLQRKNALLFIGAYSPERAEKLKQINFPICVYGKGWDCVDSSHIEIHSKNISMQQVAQLYQQYKYVFNAVNRKNTRQGLTMRCFDAMASGNILITEFSDDLNYCFKPDQIFTFTDNASLQSVFTQLATYSEQALYELTLSNQQTTLHLHTYAKRLLTIAEHYAISA